MVVGQLNLFLNKSGFSIREPSINEEYEEYDEIWLIDHRTGELIQIQKSEELLVRIAGPVLGIWGNEGDILATLAIPQRKRYTREAFADLMAMRREFGKRA